MEPDAYGQRRDFSGQKPDHGPIDWIGIRKDWLTTCTTFRDAFVSLPEDSFKTHALVIGSTGSGKTNLIHHLAVHKIERGVSLVILDARGDLADTVLVLAAHAGVDPAKVQFINLREKSRPVGFNPLAGGGEPYYRALGVLDSIEAESESWGVQIAETLRNAILLLAESESPLTLLEPLFFNPALLKNLVQDCKSEQVRTFWKRYGGLSPDKQNALAAPVLNKVSILFATESLRRLFGHPKPIELTRQLDTPGTITLVSLAVDELHSAGWITGSILLRSICREIFARVDVPEVLRNPVCLIVDEFEHFGMQSFESILAEGRRFRLSTVLAHQTLAQLSPKMRSIILNNVGIKAIFRTGRQDAEVLCKDVAGNTKEFDLSTLPVGEAILWLQGQGSLHIEVNAPLQIERLRKSSIARDFRAHLAKYTPEFTELDQASSEHYPMSEEGQRDRNDDLEDWL